jgi:lipoprotein-anchoring transpeptidase ErfK/SrfK
MMKIESKQTIVAAMAILILASGIQARAEASAEDTAAATSVIVAAIPQRVIVVSLEDRKLALIENGEVMKVYTVAVGKPSTPSPVGTFTIERRVANPTYSHKGQLVAPGPGNPVGTRWMGLSVRGYGIHGTNAPKSIGKAASHGCIRMSKADLEELFDLVRAGDAVEILGQRNEQTARMFGLPDMPGTGAATLTAQSAQPLPAAPAPVTAVTNVAATETQTAGLTPSVR